ncbi:hypothetical protein E4U42_002008 [Claviceps africana]|uniref:Uncharacterized protein n=1 Tax=Claviceps africana TaxID=83212 RepID=A0A8K0JET4_9HYPO|nr:hypothetical protein E4U42_002008 [Claviceps africana]
MLPRAATAFGRASTITSMMSKAMVRRAPSTIRQLSLWPLRTNRKLPQDLPLYFPRTAAAPRMQAFRRQLGRIVFATITYYLCWEIFTTVVWDPFVEFCNLDWDNLSEKEKQEWQKIAERNRDEPMLFLPFPFITTEVKQPPYKASDPEWEAFLALNKDRQAQKDIKFALAELVRRAVAENPILVNLVGGEDIKLKKTWLDIIYPPAPPPQHFISGFIINLEGIFWVTRPIDSLSVSRLGVVIYPKAVALAAWTFVNSLFGQTFRDAAKALGFNIAPPENKSLETVIINHLREEAGMNIPEKPAVQAQGSGEKPANPPASTNSDDELRRASGGDTQLGRALHDATTTLGENWQAFRLPPERGSVRIDGLVEFQGKNAHITMDVTSWFDPKQKAFLDIQSNLKHLVLNKQRPAPG